MKTDGNIKFPAKSIFFLSVGYLASNKRQTKLDAELPKNSQSYFETRYRDITGITPKPDNLNYYLWDRGANKWGVELRIYFISNDNLPSNLKRSVVTARPGSKYNSRINENNLIWDLIKYGFQLSDRQNIDLITAIPVLTPSEFF
jgi:hypothetical protein